MIARDLDYEIYSSFNHKLLAEDNIKKTISTNDFPEVAYLFQTQFSYLVDMHKREYIKKKKKQARREFEKPLLEMMR